jgi:L-fucose mutarotase/ribose pyranase (RbsD/FucU family)
VSVRLPSQLIHSPLCSPLLLRPLLDAHLHRRETSFKAALLPDYQGEIEKMERFAFYERSKAAFAIVVTGETRKYGNVILKKGVTPIA